MAKMRRTGRKITSPAQLKAIHATIDAGSPGGRAKRKKGGKLDLAAARKANKIGLKDPSQKRAKGTDAAGKYINSRMKETYGTKQPQVLPFRQTQ